MQLEVSSMKGVYPVLLSQGTDYIIVSVPDFEADTQGKDLSEAIEMARDLIGILGISMQDKNQELPIATPLASIIKENDTDIVTLIDIDFSEYRRRNDLKVVKKNCTIPSWLNYEAEKAGLNFSSLLAEAIRTKLQLPEYTYRD